ncbi:hypothetical protein LOTGIDRAFT_176071 [Lottia gigantea]|uniref:Double jelly roll-like domain-containing protein n=1 Tax=Lottia gigantea TaxID=225164 RepID=V4B8N9_LOTGI|nr:hypothetical protein LOTGIDRAFT_176071 [Lottia gigantea]ESO85149.1 hypothetical protein LOTGIDRAFT_176071 [Lottia gigantea]
MVLEAGSNPIETIKHPGKFDTMLKTVLYPKVFESVSGWIPDVGDGSVLKEPVKNLAIDADLARVRVVARNTIKRVDSKKRVLQYNNIVENNRWGNYVNWKLYPLFGLLEHRKVSIGLPYKIHLQREINDDKIFFGENGSDAKLEITNLQLFIPVITPSIEVETRIFNSLTKDIEIAFLHRNTVGSMTLTGESTTWPITNTIKPARYLMAGFKNLPDSQTNNNNVVRVAMNQTQNPLIHKVHVRLNNDNYPNQPLTINPTTKDYNELYRNYKNMCELFGNPPQFEYVDFALNHPIFCFDLSAHQEDLFKTGVNINIHIEKTQGDVTGYCLLLEEAKHLIKIADRRMIRIEVNRFNEWGYIGIADYKDLLAYSKFLNVIKKTGPETRRLQDVEKYLNKVIPDEEESDDYAEDYPPIIREIDELEEEIARENSGQGITFLFDNNEELLNRLEIILAAMKEGHRSHRQYNEVNCILKRLLEKGIIDKNDYKSVIKNVK